MSKVGSQLVTLRLRLAMEMMIIKVTLRWKDIARTLIESFTKTTNVTV